MLDIGGSKVLETLGRRLLLMMIQFRSNDAKEKAGDDGNGIAGSIQRIMTIIDFLPGLSLIMVKRQAVLLHSCWD